MGIISLREITLQEGYQQGRDDGIDECIKVMKYCWYNGQQPLDVLIKRLEQLKEKNERSD